ncbi:MAG: ATP-binding protein [Thermoproteus sp. AZ2]|uniref:ATP-binding protein n=1 Tax=Thermoproteus sp. AZ2 TaxID=1609232 RepID=A0ACC6V2P3_9CREN
MEIGIVVSGATISSIPVQIYRHAERHAQEEQMVAVKDVDTGITIVGFLRRITKLEPIVRDKVRTPFVDRPEMLEYSVLLPYTTAVVKPYVEVAEDRVKEVEHVPTPGSKVFLLRGGPPVAVPQDRAGFVGAHKYSGWEMPLDLGYITHHVGVFGATGMGKSRLVRALVEELAKRGLRIVIFDHTGVDYAPYYDNVVKSSEIKIPPNVLASVIAKMADLPWQSYGEYLEIATMTFEGQWSKDAFVAHVKRTMKRLNARDTTVERVELFIKHFIDPQFFADLNSRGKTPADVLSSRQPVAVDLSWDRELAVKQAIVASVIEEAWAEVRRAKEPRPTVFVIDEAQNYAPSDWAISKDAIETTAREGRKWGLSLILASQRIAGDIDPSIRANLGTVFFSRVTAPTDLREISAYLDLADVNEGVLAQLQPREFFVVGLMNPLRRPVLLKIREVK